MAQMTEEEAEAMLKQLSEHFGEPVQPITRYCKALNGWADCIRDRTDRERKALFPNFSDFDKTSNDWTPTAKAQRQEHEALMKSANFLGDIINKGGKPTVRDYQLEDLKRFESFADHVGDIFMQISKSSLLGRTLYGGEKIRTRMCPEHKGTWVGCESDVNYCKHGCGFTGWLPEEPEKPPVEKPAIPVVWTDPKGSCSNCQHCGMDMDMDPYCAHPTVRHDHAFGLNVSTAIKKFCGKDNRLSLWEPRK